MNNQTGYTHDQVLELEADSVRLFELFNLESSNSDRDTIKEAIEGYTEDLIYRALPLSKEAQVFVRVEEDATVEVDITDTHNLNEAFIDTLIVIDLLDMNLDFTRLESKFVDYNREETHSYDANDYFAGTEDSNSYKLLRLMMAIDSKLSAGE